MSRRAGDSPRQSKIGAALPGEHAVAVEVVLGAEHLDRRTLDQGVAPIALVPRSVRSSSPRLQRDAVGAVDEAGSPMPCRIIPLASASNTMLPRNGSVRAGAP